MKLGCLVSVRVTISRIFTSPAAHSNLYSWVTCFQSSPAVPMIFFRFHLGAQAWSRKKRGVRKLRSFGIGCLKNHPRTCKWLGSPPLISHQKAIWKGNNPILRGLTITMVINHLLNGMILQVFVYQTAGEKIFIPSSSCRLTKIHLKMVVIWWLFKGTRWWLRMFFCVHPCLGRRRQLTSILFNGFETTD